MLIGFDIGLAIALGGVSVSVLGWFRSQTRSQYAREREYAHIQKTLDQNAHHILHLVDSLDVVDDRLSRLEVLLIKEAR